MSDIIFKKQNVFNRKLYYIPTFPGAVTLFFVVGLTNSG